MNENRNHRLPIPSPSTETIERRQTLFEARMGRSNPSQSSNSQRSSSQARTTPPVDTQADITTTKSEQETAAPDFTLRGTQGETIREFSLSEFAAGRPTVLVFYIYDFSPVCTEQMCEINDMEVLTFNDDAAVLGISTDGPYSHQHFIEETGISYPLLTDHEKDLYEQFGMLERTDSGKRATKRGAVLLDANGNIDYSWQAEDNWDEWQMDPLYEINDRINELTR